MSESIRLVHPTTGAPLLAGASLSGLYMVLAHQIVAYDIPRTGSQHSDFLKQFIVLDCQSFAVGFHLITNATKGQIIRAEAIGNAHGGGVAKIT